MEKLLTIKEAAEAINVHPDTLRRLEKKGKIKPIRIGTRGDRRYTQIDLMRVVGALVEEATETKKV